MAATKQATKADAPTGSTKQKTPDIVRSLTSKVCHNKGEQGFSMLNKYNR